MLLWRRTFFLVFSTLLAGCGSLPMRGEVPDSQAFTDTATTTLARLAASSRPPGEVAPSGFGLLLQGEFAFDARVALLHRAERSLDLQYYTLHRDQSGRMLLRELRDAAQRGVRVRLLVDDLYAAEIQDLLAALASYPNAQVRLFNPMPMRHGAPLIRLAMSAGAFQLYSRRMHNKLFIADNAVAIYGGRNVADEYFMKNDVANFIDFDAISTGWVVRDLSQVFDQYWNSLLSWPVHTVLGRLADEAQARRQFDAAVEDASIPVPEPAIDSLGQPSTENQLREGRLKLSYATAGVFADPPEKAADPALAMQPTPAVSALLAAFSTAKREVLIVSPYFVPGPVGMPLIRKARENGVRISIFTNSLGSTDVPLVHHSYAAYRLAMLRIGVDLYEVSPTQTRRSRRFGTFGRSIPRLHAKVAIVDRERLLVGSANMDGRSAVGNTEMGVIIDSPVLAAKMVRRVADESLASVYKLRLLLDGNTIEWVGTDDDGRTSATTEEPSGGWWVRLRLWLQSLVVAERDL